MGSHKRSFERYHPRPPTPTASPSPKIGGSQPHPKSAIAIISGTAKARDFKTGRYIQLKIWEKRERGRIQGFPKFFEYPQLSQERVKLRIFGTYSYRVHPNKSPLKIWEKRERGRIRGLPKFLAYPLLSQERVKLRTSNFVCTFSVSIGTNAHYKFREK